MGKLINLNGDADKNKTLQKILEQLDTLKDELAELLSESEDTDTDSAGMDAMPLQRLWTPWKTLQN